MKTIFRLFVASAVVGLVGVARGIPQLRISDGTATILVVDNGPGDINPDAGAILWSSPLGIWKNNIISAVTKPALGQADLPWMDLTFFDVSSRGGVLSLTFTETDFINNPYSWGNMNLAGFTTGSVQYDFYGAAFGPTRDTAFDLSRHLGTLGPASGTFALKDAKQEVGYGYFSLTQLVTINHSSAGFTSGVAIGEVPETDATVPLLMIGLVAVGLLTRSGKKRRFYHS